MLVFEERGKLEFPEKNLSEQRREPTSNPGQIGGRRALSPLRHSCSPKQYIGETKRRLKDRFCNV